jgi:hypothetical protein
VRLCPGKPQTAYGYNVRELRGLGYGVLPYLIRVRTPKSILYRSFAVEYARLCRCTSLYGSFVPRPQRTPRRFLQLRILFQSVFDSLTQLDELFHPVGGQERAANYALFFLAYSVHSASALNKYYNCPRQIVVNYNGAVLQILALA